MLRVYMLYMYMLYYDSCNIVCKGNEGGNKEEEKER